MSWRHNLYIPVTEREINAGILEALSADRHCMVYFRKITDFDHKAEIARNYIDLKANGEIDEEATEFLRMLREIRIPKRLGEDSIGQFEVEGLTSRGIEEKEHEEYLATLAESFRWVLGRRESAGLQF